ncbi:DUF4908 domain-containing protein [Brevundimonas sp. FT23042]|uniref:DUF4908 domain-containing protein n=1 Tax=Brevundimonas sp. FT23042 TaxID=3393749 RepID=UPI003B586A94
MKLTGKVRTASTPLQTAMAFAVAVSALLFATGPVAAQERGNAQAEQSQALRERGVGTRTLPRVGHYVSESGEAFTLDRSGQLPLLRFDVRDETWVLRPTPAPRGDVIYRNDAGQQILRLTPGGGITVFTTRAPSGSPASFTGPGESLANPRLGPLQLWQLMARRSALISQATGRLISINLDGERSEALCVEALIVTTDAVIRMARSPTTRASLNGLRTILITEGRRSSVTFAGGVLTVELDPDQGMAGRPSSARVIRALLTEPSRTR